MNKVYDILGTPLERITRKEDGTWLLTMTNGCTVSLGDEMSFSAPVGPSGEWLGSLNGRTIPDDKRSPEQVQADCDRLSDGVRKLFQDLDSQSSN